MKTKQTIQVLLVEDDSADVQALKAVFADLRNSQVKVTHAGVLAAALDHLSRSHFDIILLDLRLPDSAGVETFAQVHRSAPETPVLVLAGADDETLALQAVEEGAQDYLLKKQVQSPLLSRSIRYAIERSQLQQALAETRQKQHQARELSGIDRLSEAPGTSITAGIYSAQALRETAPEEFNSIVLRYQELLDQALEHRLFKTEQNGSGNLQNMADELGFLRATPRDVIEIHSIVLKKVVEGVPWQKAQAYLQEGRLTVLALMGYLTGYYRNYYPARTRKELAP